MMCSKWKTCQTKTEEVDIAPAMKQEVYLNMFLLFLFGFI